MDKMETSPLNQSKTKAKPKKFKLTNEQSTNTFTAYYKSELETLGGIDKLFYGAYTDTLLEHGINYTDLQSELKKYEPNDNSIYRLLDTFRTICEQVPVNGTRKSYSRSRSRSHSRSRSVSKTHSSTRRIPGYQEFSKHMKEELKVTDKNGKSIYSKFSQKLYKNLTNNLLKESKDTFKDRHFHGGSFIKESSKTYKIIETFYESIGNNTRVSPKLGKLTKLY